MSGVAARHDPVQVRAEAEEGDITEIEQAGEPDDDVQSKRKQRVDDGNQPVAEEIALVRNEREDHEGTDEDGKSCNSRQPLPCAGNEARDTGARFPALLDVCDPLVDADARPIAGVGRLWSFSRHTAQTFWITGDPRRPLGRTRNMAINSANT